jgi:transporter family protein
LSIRTTIVFILISANALLFTNAFQQIKTAPKTNLIFLAISGITTSFSWIFYYRAMQEGQVSYVASIDKASIVVTLLLSFLFLKEPFTLRVAIGASCILLGMIVLIWK